MRRTILSAALALAAVGAMAQPARADQACIDGCNKDFTGNDLLNTSLRGWCYILRNCIAEE